MLQRSLRGVLFALSLLTFACTITPPGSYAQSAVDGAITGTVLDSNSAVVSGATITVRNNGTNAEQKVVSDASGFFRIIHLQPAVYDITIDAAGFNTFKSTNVLVQVGVTTDVQAALTVGGASQTVEVTGEAPMINTSTPDFAGVIPQNTLTNLPENNYRWSAVALLTPGVVNDSNGYGLISFRGQSTLLNNITIDGTDDNQAYFAEERGRTRAGYSTIKESIQEFQVNTSNYSVEYGRSAGGIVNSVTKSGTNAFHGSGYYFLRDSQWAAINPTVTHLVPGANGKLAPEAFKPSDLRRQYGFTVGGPLLKDRLFFFVAGDRFYHYFPAAATITSGSAAQNFALAPAAAATCPGGNYATANVCQISKDTGLSYASALAVYNNGIQGLNSMLGTVPRIGDQTIWFPKIDWQVTQKHHVSVEGNRVRWISPAGIQTAPAAAYGVSSFGNDYVRDTWLVGKLDSLLTPTISNQARYMYGRDFEFENNQAPTPFEQNNIAKTAAGYVNPLGLPTNVYLQGFFQFGVPQFLNRAALPDERRWQIADTVDWQKGNHDLRFGVDYIHTYDLISNLYNQFGGYTYNDGSVTLGDYIADQYLSSKGLPAQNYYNFNQGAGLPGLDFTTGDYAVFVQDQWKASRRLSLTLGVRWEYEQMPDPQIANPNLPQTSKIPDNKANVAPRVGFAYDVYGQGKTILRGGYGMFFARAINSTIYQALISTGGQGAQTNPSFYPGEPGVNPACVPSFPQVIAPDQQAVCLGGAGGNATAQYLDPNFKVPQIHQADLTLEQQLGPNDSFSVAWLGSWGRRLPDFVDINLPKPTPVNFVVNGTVPGGLPNGATFTANAFLGGQSARPIKGFSSITDIFSGVTSNYEAAVWQYQHRFSHYLSFNGNYTWSHALDYGVNNTTGASTTSLLDPTNIRLDYGNSLQNVPSRMVLYAVIDGPWHVHGPLGYVVNDFQISPDFQAQSGLPYSMGITGSAPVSVDGIKTTSLVATGSFNGSGGSNRVPVADRNEFQQPRINVVDLRVSKRLVFRESYRLEFLGEAFNLANHQNVTSVSGTAYQVTVNKPNGSSTYVNQLTPYTTSPFSSITAVNNSNFAYSQRQLQLALRLQF